MSATILNAPVLSPLAPPPTSKETNTTETLAFSSIPQFDFDEYESGNADQRQDFIKRYGEAFKEFGFVAIKATHLTPLFEAVSREQLDYFHQPQSVKKQDIHNNNAQTGFGEYGIETAAGEKEPDAKEFYHVAGNHPTWPVGRPQFEKVMKECHSELSDLAAKAIYFLGLYLGTTFDQEAIKNGAAHLLRLAFYPAPAHNLDKKGKWAAPHKDLNGITLLLPTTPGLQLKTKEGKFVDVIVPPGYIIANTGEQIEKITAGEMKAVEHQVINPGDAWAYEERISTPFFGSLPNDFSLKPLLACVERMTQGMSEEEKEKFLLDFPDVTVLENLLSRLIEMGTLKDPGEELVKSLRSKGLLRSPPDQLIEAFPHLFTTTPTEE